MPRVTSSTGDASFAMPASRANDSDFCGRCRRSGRREDCLFHPDRKEKVMPAHLNHHGPVAEVTLDWQEVRNAIGPNEARELRQALEQAVRAPEVGALVLSGAGKAFCAGGNLPALLEVIRAGGKPAIHETIYTEFQGVFRAIDSSPVPVITAVDGPAVGWGCDLALAGSATLIGSKGWLAQGWIKAGLVPATGGTLYTLRRAGPQAVWRMLAADRVDGPTAEQWQLAIACEDARSAALEMAARLAALPRAALRATRQLASIDSFDEHLKIALKHQADFLTDPEFEARAAKLLGR
ncbi:MAG: enoyl-CoA hydratase/isomerase family protein [Rhodocyclaceae bacterium]|nr:enoyl-CoA hydratase/isomerase family protein [Rhodocyclaceae bacterium]